MNLPTGNRFQAALSPSKKRADIMDRKLGGGLSMLSLEEIEELHQKVAHLVQGHQEKFAVKLLEKGSRHVLVGLNEEDGRELLELFATLEGMMVPASA
jgi:hypothetical protein